MMMMMMMMMVLEVPRFWKCPGFAMALEVPRSGSGQTRVPQMFSEGTRHASHMFPERPKEPEGFPEL
eukprot:819308-Karenia_brevis.AAC.1